VKKHPNVSFENDANVAGIFFGVSRGIQGLTVVNTLGTGIGFALAQNGHLIPGLLEGSAVRIDFSPDAISLPGLDVAGALEGLANTDHIKRRTIQLAEERGMVLPVDRDQLNPGHLGEWLREEDPALLSIAQQVFQEIGERLGVLYNEVSRVKGQKEFTVVLAGGWSQGEAGREVVNGIKKKLKEFPSLQVKVIMDEEITGQALGTFSYQETPAYWRGGVGDRLWLPCKRRRAEALPRIPKAASGGTPSLILSPGPR